MTPSTGLHRLRPVGLLVPLLLAAAGCGASPSAAATPAPAKTLRLGFFANVTHATPLVGVKEGYYAKRLGATTLETQVFNAGPAAVEALFAGSIDAAYVGPSPAVNAFTKSKGDAVRIVAGATEGGAALVVKPGITDVSQLRGKTLATPQLGGTQDVALRHYLADHKLKTEVNGSGDVTVSPTDNATSLQLFRDGKIDGAWAPEPWASRLVLEGKGSVLVDEKSLWPGGKFVTTNLLVSRKFLDRHPQTVTALLQGQVDTNAWIAAHPAEAKTSLNAELAALAGKGLTPAVLDRAFADITVTNDPDAASLQTSARNAEQVGLLQSSDLKGIYDLRLLGQVLGTTIDDAGLGKKKS
ncbi:MAG: ABC transporter substrate-binding protein [Actinomycetota bacterium]|nr:ABC transporter substrate-binding protein [Actinomycetota bacterium]